MSLRPPESERCSSSSSFGRGGRRQESAFLRSWLTGIDHTLCHTGGALTLAKKSCAHNFYVDDEVKFWNEKNHQDKRTRAASVRAVDDGAFIFDVRYHRASRRGGVPWHCDLLQCN